MPEQDIITDERQRNINLIMGTFMLHSKLSWSAISRREALDWLESVDTERLAELAYLIQACDAAAKQQPEQTTLYAYCLGPMFALRHRN